MRTPTALRRRAWEPGHRPAAPIVRQEAGRPAVATTLPVWDAKGFKPGLAPASREADSKSRPAGWLAGPCRRPFVSTFVLLSVVGTIAIDGLVLARRCATDEWAGISFDLGPSAAEALPARAPDRPPDSKGEGSSGARHGVGAGISSLPPARGARNSRSPAVFRASGQSLRAPGMALGLSAAAAAPAASAMLLKRESLQFEAAAAQGPLDDSGGRGRGFFSEAGAALETFAAISKTPPAAQETPAAAPGYAGADHDAVRDAPQGSSGDDLVQAMVGDGFKHELKQYASSGHWKLRKTAPGEKMARHELADFSLTGNHAVIQLVQTKRSTDAGLRCRTCRTEDRVVAARSAFFGERR